MEYMGNKEYWDDKFAKRSDNLLSPEKSLIENIIFFKKGSILDLACGDGRNTLFLLENGFKVTGVDFSSKALERLDMFAKRKNYLVNTKQIDLTDSNSLNSIGVFDNILVNHYRLNKEQLLKIGSHITDGGILFICGFGYNHKVDAKIKKEDLIQPTDFEDIKKSFELIGYIEGQDDRGFLVTYIFRKFKRKDCSMFPEYKIFANNIEYTIKLLSCDDEISVQDLCERCSDFSLLIEGRLPDKDAGHDILFDLPPNKDLNDKFVLGVYKNNDVLTAVIDLVKDYKAQGEWTLGLMMIDPGERGKGLGERLHEYIKTMVLESKGIVLRIGVVEENYKAYEFWKRMGYIEVDRTKAKYGSKEHVVAVMNLNLA